MTDKKPKLDAEFAFIIIKKRDGGINIANFDDPGTDRQPTIDDIYSAISIVQRDLQTNQVIGGIAGLLQQAAQGAPTTESGLVVPKPSQKFSKNIKRID